MINTIVIIDNNAVPIGGTAQVAISSAAELSRQGKRVIYFAGANGNCPQLQNSGVEVHSIGVYSINTDPNKIRAAINGIWNVKAARELQRLLMTLDRNSTVVHIHGYVHYLSVSIINTCKKMGFHTVLTMHDYFTACPCGGFYDYGEKNICKRKPMSLQCVFCNCDKRSYLQKIWRMARQLFINQLVRFNCELNLIYISEFSYSKLKPWLKAQNTYFVRNPYDLGDESVYEAEYNHDYLYVGRLSEEKGVEIFCEALSTMIARGEIKGRVRIVGSGNCQQRLQEQYPEMEFLGWKTHSEMVEIMKTARCFIMPSRWYEGAPLTPIEFMSHGIPCIISDCCAAIEYIQDKKNGILFQTENVESLISAVRLAEDDVFWSDVAACLRSTFVRDEYSVETHTKTLLRVYEEILKQ